MGYKLQKIYVGTHQVRPEHKRQPGANTLLYMPLDGDVLDYSGNQNNGTWYGTTEYKTVGSKKYAYINTNSAITLSQFPVGTGNPNDFTFVCRGIPNASTGYLCSFHMGSDYTGKRFCFIFNYPEGSNSYRHIMDLYQYNANLSDSFSTPQSKGQRCLIIYTYEKSSRRETLYINNVQTGSATNYSLNLGSNFKYIGRPGSNSIYANYGLSEVIFEKGIWTQQQREDYFNITKSAYGIN